jgi:hypothetical protein
MINSIGEKKINEAPHYKFSPETQVSSREFYFRNPRPYVFPLILYTKFHARPK